MLKMACLQESTLIDQLPGYVWWTDINSVYLKANKNLARILGYSYSDKLIGLTDYDVPCKAAEWAEIFIQEDQKVKKQGTVLVILDQVIYANDQAKTLLVNKKLFYDDNAQAVGIAGQAIDLNSAILKNLRFLLDTYQYHQGLIQPSFYLNSEYEGVNFSKQQALCLFYLLRGKTNKIIAKILRLSPRTVEAYINTIKYKMGCLNKNDLSEKSIALKFFNIVPPGIINFPVIDQTPF